jgi:hypothetical protein
MQNLLKALRYLIFGKIISISPKLRHGFGADPVRVFISGIFIICNAIVASVAVWNHSLAQSVGWTVGSAYIKFGAALVTMLICIRFSTNRSIPHFLGMFWAGPHLHYVRTYVMIMLNVLLIRHRSIFVELACENPITGRVWFECTWVGSFWLLYLGERFPALLELMRFVYQNIEAGAAAVSAIVPNMMCNALRKCGRY